MELSDISRALWGTGLSVRGGFHPGPDDLVPTATPTGTLIMIGNAGAAMWRAFAASPEFQDRAARAHAMDDWTARVLDGVALDLGATVLFPFRGPPYHPFQKWAQRADTVFPSPIGPLVHPEFGLWHAYRGALTFEERIALPARPAAASPCETCTEKPCLHTCPVEAFTVEGYAVPRCVGHLTSADGADCIDLGCRARRACPVGQAFHYEEAQATFHQRHFLRSNGLEVDPEPGF